MVGQRVVAEVSRDVAPHRVDVVGAVLGVVVLDHGGGPVDAEVVRLARLRAWQERSDSSLILFPLAESVKSVLGRIAT